jgi:transposase
MGYGAFENLGMREEVLTDQLWERLEPLLPVRPRRFRYPGRKRADDRAALEGILYVIRTGIGWNRQPTALFGASGATCWRRLSEWHEAGVWQQLAEIAHLTRAQRPTPARVPEVLCRSLLIRPQSRPNGFVATVTCRVGVGLLLAGSVTWRAWT